jgi:hypothetical protein
MSEVRRFNLTPFVPVSPAINLLKRNAGLVVMIEINTTGHSSLKGHSRDKFWPFQPASPDEESSLPA